MYIFHKVHNYCGAHGKEKMKTRKHFSRMHTARLLIIVVEYTPPVTHPWSHTPLVTHPLVTHPPGHPLVIHTPTPLHSGIHPLPHCMLGYTTLVNRMTDRCKNITLPQTSFAGGKNGNCCNLVSKVICNFREYSSKCSGGKWSSIDRRNHPHKKARFIDDNTKRTYHQQITKLSSDVDFMFVVNN